MPRQRQARVLRAAGHRPEEPARVEANSKSKLGLLPRMFVGDAATEHERSLQLFALISIKCA
jgi:hypothetical protein